MVWHVGKTETIDLNIIELRSTNRCKYKMNKVPRLFIAHSYRLLVILLARELVGTTVA